MVPGDELLAEAARLIDTPFRLHGRDPAVGLDCVGLIGAALAAVGRRFTLPEGYRLRRTDLAQMEAAAAAAGLLAIRPPVRPGDILLLRSGPAQLHLALADQAGGIIHAHAGLRRVVRTPPPLAWPIAGSWRLPPQGE